MDPVDESGGVSFRVDTVNSEYSEVQKRLEDLEQQLLNFRSKVQQGHPSNPDMEPLDLSKELASKGPDFDDYEYSQDEEDQPPQKPAVIKPEEPVRRSPPVEVPPLALKPGPLFSPGLPQMPYPFPNFPMPQPQMFGSMPAFPGMNFPMPTDPASKERTRKMLLEQSKLLEDLAKQMKQRELASLNSSFKEAVPESVEKAIADLRTRCERLETDKQRLASQVDKLKQQPDLPEPERPNRLELKQAMLEIGTLRSEQENLKFQLTQVSRERDRFRAEKDGLEQELTELKDALSAKTAQMDRPSRENSNLQSQVARLQQQNKELLLSYQTLQKEFDQVVVDRRVTNKGMEKKAQPGSLNIFDQTQPYGEPRPQAYVAETRVPRRAQDNHDIIQNLEAKLSALQTEKSRVRTKQLVTDIERWPESSQRREDLTLECEILDTNINSLKQKLKKYNKLT